MHKLIYKATLWFPIWAIIFSILAYINPNPWINLKNLIFPLLGLVMFSMGLTLQVKDFYRVFSNLKIVFLGIILQFLFMPFLGFLLTSLFQLELIIGAGLILVGCSPGGTASNVICYLAKGDVALSISLTICSTLLAIFFTPILFWFYTGSNIEVPIAQMMTSIFKIILFPVVLGIILNSLNMTFIKKIKIVLPLIAVIAIVLIIAIIIGTNASQILVYGISILFVVALHNFLGFIGGYYSCSLIGLDKRIKRTIAIEVAMQNSGLATALAIKYYGALSAIPGAFYSIWHNISGSLIASYWKKNS